MCVPLIDGHCHIPHHWLAADGLLLRDVLRRCRQHAVDTVVVAVDCSAGGPEFDLPMLRPHFASSGVRLAVVLGYLPPTRPTDVAAVADRLPAALDSVRRLARESEVVGVGEVGLDHYWPPISLAEEARDQALKPPEPDVRPDAGASTSVSRAVDCCHAVQADVFGRWIDLALELDLPLVVHERDAHGQAARILRHSGIPPRRVMFHCCSCSPTEAARDAAYGYWISLPSSLVHRDAYRQIAEAVPVERLCIETDAPYHCPIIGLWKRSGTELLNAGSSSGSQHSDREVQQLRRKRFAALIEQELPGLTFSVGTGQATTTVPASEYFRSSKHRSENEPTFVRFAATEIAVLKGLDTDTACRVLRQNVQSFFNL